MVADEYAAAGFVAVVQDNIYGGDVVRWLERVQARPRPLVVLRPAVGVVEARHEERRRRLGKVAFRGGYTAAANDADLAMTPSEVGLWIDTSDLSPAETADLI